MISVEITGKSSKEAAEQLIVLTNQKGSLRQKRDIHSKDKRLLEYTNIVDFSGNFDLIVDGVSSVVTLAVIIWKWRRELSRVDVKLRREDEENKKEIDVLKDSTSVEEVQEFLEEQ